MTAADADLPQRLKAGTRDWHARAERSGAMAQLLQGGLPPLHYLVMLRSLQAIYAALEQGLRQHAGHALIEPLPIATVERSAALAADVCALRAVKARASLSSHLPPAARAYARRLQALARGPRPWLLVAHAYVRYLGDLHGGQILRERVRRVLQPLAIDATAFYDFGDAADVRTQIEAFRAGLREIGQRDPAAVAALVREARRGFAWHVRLFAEIAPDADAGETPMAFALDKAQHSPQSSP